MCYTVRHVYNVSGIMQKWEEPAKSERDLTPWSFCIPEYLRIIYCDEQMLAQVYYFEGNGMNIND